MTAPRETSSRALIFGASGGIGAALCAQLAQRHPDWRIHAGGRQEPVPVAPNITPFAFDLTDEESIERAVAVASADGPLDLVLVATGVLQTEAFGPEKTWRALDADVMARVLAVNAIGPALIAKHALGALRKDGRAVFAAIAARVGSISDNRLGGWHSYRASKAALVMLLRNFAIELARSNPQALAVALHPGTVDTPLSEPFQGNVPKGTLFTPDYSAGRLLAVLDDLTPKDSGRHFAWDGAEIPA